MITRTTLKTLWLAGGGVVATWLAVSPNHSGPATSPAPPAQRPSAKAEITAEEFNAQAGKIRSRTNAIALQQSTRNPFRFNAPRRAGQPASRAETSDATVAGDTDVAPTPAAPMLTLSGVAEKKTPDGPRRTAVISGEGQIYLAGVGDLVAGRYTVIAIDPEAVVLRDAAGVELRLVMRP